MKTSTVINRKEEIYLEAENARLKIKDKKGKGSQVVYDFFDNT